MDELSAEQRRLYAHTLIERRLMDSGLPHEDAHRRALDVEIAQRMRELGIVVGNDPAAVIAEHALCKLRPIVG